MTLTRMALRNVFRNGGRSILSGLAIAVAALSIVMMFSLSEGMSSDLVNNITTYNTGEIQIQHLDFEKYERQNPLHLNIKNGDYLTNMISQIEGVKSVSPRVVFPSRIYRDGKNYNSLGWGVDFSREAGFEPLNQIMVSENGKKNRRPQYGFKGTLPRPGMNEALISQGLAKKLGLEIGQKFTVLAQTASRGTNAVTFTISGMVHLPVAELDNSLFMAPLDKIQNMIRMKDSLTQILVKAEPGTDLKELAETIKYELPAGSVKLLSIRSWKEIETVYSFMEMADISYGIMALFFLVLGSTVIINTTIMVIFERTREIGTLAALGMTSGELILLFFIEAFFISFLGSLTGVLTGIGLTSLTGITGIPIGKMMEGIDFEVSSVIYPLLNLKSTLFVFLYSVLISSAATFLPSLKASRIEPMEALRAQ